MKHLNLIPLALSAILLLSFNSCGIFIDQCNFSDNCENGGTCEDGECDCLEGFSGENCESEDLCITGNLICENGGTCFDNSCDCADNWFGATCTNYCENGSWDGSTCNCSEGYEGSECTVISRDKFIGTYFGSDQCSSSGASGSYNLSISEAGGDVNVRLLGLWAGFFNNSVIATATGTSIIIPLQEPDNDGYTIDGSGILNGNSLEISFTVNGNGFIDACTASLDK